MIEGLKLTMTGEEVRMLIERRAATHRAKAAHWMEEAALLRDHLDPSETYRLGETDLEFAELLPEEPEMCGPDDSEDLGPYARRISNSPEIVEILNPDHPANR